MLPRSGTAPVWRGCVGFSRVLRILCLSLPSGKALPMNHRQRMLAALQHRAPDRVPRLASLTPGVLDAFHAMQPGVEPEIGRAHV